MLFIEQFLSHKHDAGSIYPGGQRSLQFSCDADGAALRQQSRWVSLHAERQSVVSEDKSQSGSTKIWENKFQLTFRHWQSRWILQWLFYFRTVFHPRHGKTIPLVCREWQRSARRQRRCKLSGALFWSLSAASPPSAVKSLGGNSHLLISNFKKYIIWCWLYWPSNSCETVMGNEAFFFNEYALWPASASFGVLEPGPPLSAQMSATCFTPFGKSCNCAAAKRSTTSVSVEKMDINWMQFIFMTLFSW